MKIFYKSIRVINLKYSDIPDLPGLNHKQFRIFYHHHGFKSDEKILEELGLIKPTRLG